MRTLAVVFALGILAVAAIAMLMSDGAPDVARSAHLDASRTDDRLASNSDDHVRADTDALTQVRVDTTSDPFASGEEVSIEMTNADVRIVDDSGRAVAGAVVIANPTSTRIEPVKEWSRSRTDEGGVARVAFPRDAAKVGIHVGTMGIETIARFATSDWNEAKSIVVDDDLAIELEFVDANGERVDPDATRFFGDDPDDLPIYASDKPTEHATLERIELGLFRLHTRRDEPFRTLSTFSGGAAAATSPELSPQSRETRVRIALEPRGIVDVLVVDASTGVPLANIDVRASRRRSQTDAQGSAFSGTTQTTGADGIARFVALEPALTKFSAPDSALVSVDVDPAAARQHIELRLPSRASIAGTLVGVDGEPLAGLVVGREGLFATNMIVDDDSISFFPTVTSEQVTDADGAFLLQSLAPGRCSLVVSTCGSAHTFSILVAPGETRRVRISPKELKCGALHGVVHVADPQRHRVRLGADRSTIDVRDDGSFDFPLVRAGKDTLTVVDTRTGTPKFMRPIVVRVNERTSVEIRGALGILRAHVTDAVTGKPIASADVSLDLVVDPARVLGPSALKLDARFMTGTTDADGWFVARDIEQGPYRIAITSATKRGSKSSTRDIIVGADTAIECALCAPGIIDVTTRSPLPEGPGETRLLVLTRSDDPRVPLIYKCFSKSVAWGNIEPGTYRVRLVDRIDGNELEIATTNAEITSGATTFVTLDR